MPLYFASAPGCLYGFATMGQKIEWMRVNPTVCVEADEVRSHKDWASVVVRGRYEEFPDTPQYSKQRQEAQSILENRGRWWWETGFASAQIRGRVRSRRYGHILHLTSRRSQGAVLLRIPWANKLSFHKCLNARKIFMLPPSRLSSTMAEIYISAIV